MGKTDGLSRRLDWKVGVEKDNDNQVFINNCWLHSLHKVVYRRTGSRYNRENKKG